ncbi:copper resistance protein CopC [Thioalkalivibrio nitratireducens DSM 14787]|uniref:Copper resistance protein D n=1 Tax=Thioalkalivibrio nitratireducens (strain DSM 14787 / UNIQEM 213 / ALEN2) TaxID=1255043 RepID=L0E1A9_THIND|nr:copper resistance protein CopC [Thioalkalivibrio nitratireducens DSM 14787]
MEFFWTTLVLAGLVFLLAPGFVRYAILPSAAPDPIIGGRRLLPWAGVGMLAAGTVGDVLQVIWTALGTLDPEMTSAYLTETRHGRISLSRLGLLVAFLAAWRLLPRRAGWAAHAFFGAALVLSVSLTSHAAGDGRHLLVAADAVHLAAVAAWVGTVVCLALMPVWNRKPAPAWLPEAMRRTSAVGLAGVIAILVTGTYGIWSHFWSPAQVLGTPYGQALLLKLFLVALILGIAALNRWALVPGAARTGTATRLGWSIRVEAGLLILALVAAGYYVTRSPPGAPSSLLDPVELAEQLGPYRIDVAFVPADPGFRLQLDVTDLEAVPLATDPGVHLVLDMTDHRMVPLRPAVERIGPGQYRARDVFTMPGRWQARLQVGDETMLLFLDARP